MYIDLLTMHIYQQCASFVINLQLHCVYDDLLTVKLTEDLVSFSKLQAPSIF